MRIIDLTLKDISQVVRDKKSALYLLAMPIVFTIFFGLVFGAAGSQASDPRLPVALVNQDTDGALRTSLFALLETSDIVRPVVLPANQTATAPAMVRDGKLAAALTIPAGWEQSALQGREPALQLIVDRNTTAGGAAFDAMAATLLRLRGTLHLAQLTADQVAAQSPFADEAARATFVKDTLLTAVRSWKEPPITIQVEKASPSAAQKRAASSNPYSQASPGMIVQFTIYGLIQGAMGLVLERKTFTLRRLLTTSISRGQIVAGKLLAIFFIVLLQEILLVAVGQFALRIDYLRAPAATLLVMVTLALWVSCLGFLIGALAKGEEQVILFTLLAMFLLSAFGGAWFSLEFTGKAFATIGHAFPSAWAMDSFQNIILRGLGLASVLQPALIMVAYAILFFVLAIWRFRFE